MSYSRLFYSSVGFEEVGGVLIKWRRSIALVLVAYVKQLLCCVVENTNKVASDVNNNNRFCSLTDVHDNNVVPDVKKKKKKKKYNRGESVVNH